MILYCSMISFLSLSLTLGYLSKFNKEHINGWSSGTGMAGIVGAVLFLALCEYEKRERENSKKERDRIILLFCSVHCRSNCSRTD